MPGADGRPRIRDLPTVDDGRGELRQLLGARRPAVFLDYDGTLTPIVDDPTQAHLPDATREAIERLSSRVPVAIVSGRDLEDVRGLVDIDGIWYAGSHGFEVVDPDGRRTEQAREYLPALDSAEVAARDAIEGIDGARVERKRFAVAIHDRRVPEAMVPRVREAVESVASRHPRLRLTGGKRVHELRPAVDWDKGRALLWLIDELELEADASLPIYVGDDETDEDAFRVLAERGLGFVVRGERDDEPTWADYALADAGDARRLLEHVAAWAADDRPPSASPAQRAPGDD